MKKVLTTLLICASLAASAAINPICKGTTKAGQPCKAHAQNGGKYCRLHNPNAFHCTGTTKAGKPCQMVVKEKGSKCWIHNR